MATDAQKRVGRSMAAQVKRTGTKPSQAEIMALLISQNEQQRTALDAAYDRIAALEAQLEDWEKKAGAYRQAAGLGDSNKSKLVNQYQAAQQLGVEQYQISRWVAAGHFVLEKVEGRSRPLIVAASLHIPASKRKRKSKQVS